MTLAVKHEALTLGAGPRGWLRSAMTPKSAGFDREWWVNRVREETGKSLSEQTLEIRSLASGLGRVQSEEYYEYGLYDDRQFDDAARATLVGKASWAIMARRFNEASARDPGRDRVKAMIYLSRRGVSVPLIYAVYQNEPPANSLTEVISDAESLSHFLRHEISYPFVGTPVRLGTNGTSMKVFGYDKSADCMILEDDRRVPVINFINAVRRHGETGYIFEEAHKPYPLLMPVCGNHVTSLRMMVFRDGDVHRIVRPVWLVPCTHRPQNMIGRSGQLVAKLAPDTGIASGAMWQRGAVGDPITHHPDTGAMLEGTELPNWKRVASMVRQYAALFPKLAIQRWDVALTERGPVVTWVSGQADIQTIQKVWRKGLLVGSLGQALSETSTGSE